MALKNIGRTIASKAMPGGRATTAAMIGIGAVGLLQRSARSSNRHR